MIRALGIVVAGMAVTGCSPAVDWAASAVFGLPVSDECRDYIDRQEAAIDEETPSIKVFVRDGATTAQVSAIRSELERLEGVESVIFVSKAEALEQAKRLFEDSPDVMANLPGNPFPASFDVEIDGDAPPEADLRSQLGSLPGVDDVVRGGDKAERALDAMRDGAMGRECHEFMDEMNEEMTP